MFTSYGSNQAIVGQPHSVAWGTYYSRLGLKKGVVHCPGHTATALSYLGNDYNVVRDLVENGGRAVASFPHGANWGNSVAQGYIGSEKTYGQANWGFKAGPIDLLAGSAGAIAGLNYAKSNPTLVDRIAILIGAFNPRGIHSENRSGYAASVAAAWGGAAPPVASNPLDNIASFTGFDIGVWYSTDDSICLASEALAFGEGVGASMFSLGAVGHTINGIKTEQVLDFLNG